MNPLLFTKKRLLKNFTNHTCMEDVILSTLVMTLNAKTVTITNAVPMAMAVTAVASMPHAPIGWYGKF
jgi:hypothetical protein